MLLLEGAGIEFGRVGIKGVIARSCQWFTGVGCNFVIVCMARTDKQPANQISVVQA